jgi:hypothetical protein
MQSRPAWIGEHIQYVVFWSAAFIRYLINACIPPVLLPFFFNIPEIIFHACLLIFYDEPGFYFSIGFVAVYPVNRRAHFTALMSHVTVAEHFAPFSVAGNDEQDYPIAIGAG